jgi:hypothetical protein
VCRQILISANLQIGKRGKKTDDWRSQLRRRRSALGCNGIEGEEEGEKEGGEVEEEEGGEEEEGEGKEGGEEEGEKGGE